MKIWLAIEQDNDNFDYIIGVFSSIEAAEAHCNTAHVYPEFIDLTLDQPEPFEWFMLKDGVRPPDAK